MTTDQASGNGSATPSRVPEIKKEVHELLEHKLMGTDDAEKICTLHKLASYFTWMGDDDDAFWLKEEHRRAVTEWDGCHLVLMSLRQELARSDGPNREVAYGAIRFLGNWNIDCPERRDTFSRFGGVATIVDVLRAFRDDGEMASGVISCLLNFASDNDAECLVEIFERNGPRNITLAMMASINNTYLQTLALTLLDRLLEGANQQQKVQLVQAGALVAVATAYTTYVDSDPEICSSCTNLLNKLCS